MTFVVHSRLLGDQSTVSLFLSVINVNEPDKTVIDEGGSIRSTAKLYGHYSKLCRYVKNVKTSRELYILVPAPGYNETIKLFQTIRKGYRRLFAYGTRFELLRREGSDIYFALENAPVVNQYTRGHKPLTSYQIQQIHC
ncbi:hypothetical protein RF11_10996 [Thelohanellus kitauei]|uniref:Uncharacterized protein n=1 Tax=Thelohanellus kitauei TaxID=669202 RepID=A0A0C2JRD0_THEKT|nr:hypothetical protein RF11_10996 [Thelohanellus kitauei]